MSKSIFGKLLMITTAMSLLGASAFAVEPVAGGQMSVDAMNTICPAKPDAKAKTLTGSDSTTTGTPAGSSQPH